MREGKGDNPTAKHLHRLAALPRCKLRTASTPVSRLGVALLTQLQRLPPRATREAGPYGVAAPSAPGASPWTPDRWRLPPPVPGGGALAASSRKGVLRPLDPSRDDERSGAMTTDLETLFGTDDETSADKPLTLDDFFAPTPEMNTQGLVMRLLGDIEQAGGVAPLGYLEGHGHAEGTFLAALSKPPGDGRAKPLVRAHNINGVRVVALTSSGWTALGQPNKREQRPKPQDIEHRLSPQLIKQHIEGKASAWPSELVSVTVETSVSGINAWQDIVIARAWPKVTRSGYIDADGRFGTLTRREGCPRPDAVIYEKWGGPGRAAMWSGTQAAEQLAPVAGYYEETTILLEVETAAKHTNALKDKVWRLNTALMLGAADYVLWAVDDAAIGRRIAAATLAGTAPPGHAAGQQRQERNTVEDWTDEDSCRTRHLIVGLSQMTGRGLAPVLPMGVPAWWVALR